MFIFPTFVSYSTIHTYKRVSATYICIEKKIIFVANFNEMQLIDTHAHLFWNSYDDDLNEVIERAKNVGVTKIFCPNVDIQSIEKLNKLVSDFPDICYPLMGIHPSSVKDNFEKDLEVIEKELETGKYYGVGEVGIDLHWENNIEYKDLQIEAFRYQVRLAKKLNLPVIIHARKAFDEIFSVIDSEIDDNLYGIVHCFTGTIEQARHIMEYKTFKMGIGGVVTYKNAGVDKTIKDIDLQYLVLETDAPFLTPIPYRGKRNESSYLTFIAEKLAEIKNTTIDEMARITTENALEIFKKNQ